MLLVIFGAGASYDSAPLIPVRKGIFESNSERPPLGHELFSPRGRFLSGIQSFHPIEEIIPYLTGFSPDGSIERTLQKLQEEAATYPRRHLQLAATRWYLHFVFYGLEQEWLQQTHRVTNYRALLDQIDQWRPEGETTLLVTFNYDRILEDALRARGVKLSQLSEFIAHDRFQLVKLHGSADWAREVESEVPNFGEMNTWQVAEFLIANADNIKISDRYRIISEWPIGKGPNGPEYPAIAIPLETKQDFECPKDHIKWLEGVAPAADRILTVGWRATDRPLLQLLAKAQKTDARVMVVTSTTRGADDVLARMKTAGIRGEYAQAVEGFSEFVRTRRGEDFLRN